MGRLPPPPDFKLSRTPEDVIVDSEELSAPKMAMLLHAEVCLRECFRGKAGKGREAPGCDLNRCRPSKIVYAHSRVCRAGTHCRFPYCVLTKRLVAHRKHCEGRKCSICSGAKQLLKLHQNRPESLGTEKREYLCRSGQGAVAYASPSGRSRMC